jgi:hypothetical protein
MSAEEINIIIASEEDSLRGRIIGRVRPLVQAEVDRLHAKYPSFESLLFGNSSSQYRFLGSFMLVFTPGGPYESVIEEDGRGTLPNDFQGLWEMCKAIQHYYSLDDVYPTGKYPSDTDRRLENLMFWDREFLGRKFKEIPCGCMHPDDRDERQEWLSEFLQELLTHIQATLPSAPMNWRVPGAPYRKIVAEQHILRLECGHQIIFAGRKVPKHRTKCPFCGTNSPNP